MGDVGVLEAEAVQADIPEATIVPNLNSCVGEVVHRYYHELMRSLGRGNFPFFDLIEFMEFVKRNKVAFQGNRQLLWTYRTLRRHLNTAINKPSAVRRIPERRLAGELNSALYQQVGFLDGFFYGDPDYESTRKRYLDTHEDLRNPRVLRELKAS